MRATRPRGPAAPAISRAFSIWWPTTRGACKAVWARPISAKLDEYLTSVREVERQVEMMEQQIATKSVAVPTLDKPDGIPIDFKDHARLMFDLLAIALQTDTTRISTFMLAREGSNRSYREIGVPEGHHGLSHHRNDPALME